MKEKKEKKEACILFLIAGRIIEKNPLGTHDRCLLFFVEIVLVSAPMCWTLLDNLKMPTICLYWALIDIVLTK